jgi:hypothetical protein
MSISHKSSNIQIFRLMLYGRALHPELFNLQGRKCHRQPEYEMESWLVPAGHMVRFQVDGECLAETVLEDGDHLPEAGLVHALPCLGEKDYELDPKDGKIGYVTTIQTETLTDNLYAATYREMQDFAQENDALIHEWKGAEGAPCLSLLDCQKYKREYHIQSYHLMGPTGLVLRTQSIFEAL